MDEQSLKKALQAHAEWVPEYLAGSASFTDHRRFHLADLQSADLRHANLRHADLQGMKMPHGYEWETYLREVVPELLTAGGKTLEKVCTPEVWACNSWSNCPMHAAFNANDLDQVPPLYRGEAAAFIRYYDAGLIPNPLNATAAIAK